MQGRDCADLERLVDGSLHSGPIGPLRARNLGNACTVSDANRIRALSIPCLESVRERLISARRLSSSGDRTREARALRNGMTVSFHGNSLLQSLLHCNVNCEAYV